MKRRICIFSLALCSLLASAQYIGYQGFPAPYTSFNALLPADMLSVVFDSNTQPTMDKLYLTAQFDEAAVAVLASMGAVVEADVPYAVVYVKGDSSIEGQIESNYYLDTEGGNNPFINLSSDKINPYEDQGKRVYYSSKLYAPNMAAFANMPYISPTGIVPDMYSALLMSMLPSDFMSAVYGTDGKALMDELYLMLTLDDTMAGIVGVSAGTYATAYVKVTNSDGNEYYIPTNMIPTATGNIVIKNRPTGRNIYFTGEVSDAYTGSFSDVSNISEGFVQISGTDYDVVNVYMHDFKIKSVIDKDLGKLEDLNSAFAILAGMSAPIAVSSSGERIDNPLTVRFHIKGSNLLAGGAVSKYMSASNNIFLALADIVAMTGAPINARPNALEMDKFNQKTHKFTFDDKWYSSATATYRTNGLLDLTIKEDGDRATPSIDLGNGKGVCEFDGGRYVLTSAVSNSVFYVSSMAICYRLTLLMGNRLCGVGSSASSTTSDIDYNLYIKDGTFSTHSAYDYRGTVDVVGQGWYADYTDLRVPFKTIIDGGTFNGCEVYACDASAEQGDKPYNSSGVRLCRADVEVAKPTNTNGTATLELSYYNTESLTPDTTVDDAEVTHYYVHPYLPLDDCPNVQKEHLYNWITLIPRMGAADLLTMGGDVEVRDMEDDEITPRKNGYLFYTQLGDYTKQYAEPLDLAGFTPKVITAMNRAAGKHGVHEFSSVTNYADYTIQYGVYSMLTFDANKWYAICPPFDVHNLYVVETLPDSELANYGMTTADIGTETYLQQQGYNDGILAKGIVTSLIPDIFSGKGSGVSMNLVDIAQKTLNLPANPIVSYHPDLEGHSVREANFWLYEQKDSVELDPSEQRYGFWQVEDTVSKYGKCWAPAEPYNSNTDYVTQEGEVISNPKIWLKRGHNYSICFPAYNNYWTGKYIVFEGYGPQTLGGRNRHNEFITPYDMYDGNADADINNAVALQGNSTFANDSIPINPQPDSEATTNKIFLMRNNSTGSRPIYDWVRQDERLGMGNLNNDSVLIKPFDVFMVMSMENTENYTSLSEFNAATKAAANEAAHGGAPANQHTATSTSRPTVDERVMDIWTAHERITMFAYANEQVSIFDLTGQLMWQGNIHAGHQITLIAPQGIYIVRTENNATKVAVN